jgi:hypothetical protein
MCAKEISHGRKQKGKKQNKKHKTTDSVTGY